MKLATKEEVLARMNLGGTASKDAAVESALDASTTIIENILGTPLSATDRVDYFDLHISPYSKATVFEFNLEQGFVDGDALIFYSADGLPISDVSTLVPLDVAYVIPNIVTGLITVTDTPLAGTSTVAIKYSAGFNEGSTGIPSWMKEAAISSAVYVLHTQAATHNKKDLQDMTPALTRILRMQINSHVRPRGRGYYPSRSTVL
jgi:hypothetical protein